MKKIIGIILVVAAIIITAKTYSSKKNSTTFVRNDLQENLTYTDAFNLDRGTYLISSSQSVLSWEGKTALKKHYGTVDISSGELVVSENIVSGEITFNMETIKSEIGKGLDNHLKNEDFFNTEFYPEAKIEITGYVNNEIQGDLTIKDVTQPVSLPVKITQQNDQVVMAGSFTIDRTLWGIEYESSSIITTLGDKAINDLIDFDISLVFNTR